MKTKHRIYLPLFPAGIERLDLATQYYDYAISYVLLFQFHDYIATKMLNQDPHATNYYANKEVGNFLNNLMYPGASKDW